MAVGYGVCSEAKYGVSCDEWGDGREGKIYVVSAEDEEGEVRR